MRKVFLFLAAFCLACVVPALAGLTPPAEPAAHTTLPKPILDQPHWRKFTSPEGRFSVMLPSVPHASVIPMPASGEIMHEDAAHEGKRVYIIFYRDLPLKWVQELGADKLLSINDSAGLKAEGNPLISKRSTTLGGYLAHETITTRPNSRMGIRRICVVGNRLYTLDVLQPREQITAKPNGANKFYDSFVVLPVKTPMRNR